MEFTPLTASRDIYGYSKEKQNTASQKSQDHGLKTLFSHYSVTDYAVKYR